MKCSYFLVRLSFGGEKMKKSEIIMRTEAFMKNYFENDASGHDWYHLDRVRKLAKQINQGEGFIGDEFIIEMAALLHDFLDDKLDHSIKENEKQLLHFLRAEGISEKEIQHIFVIITTISFKGGNQAPLKTVEAQIVRDADRLDAIGAIGIARTFAYGGKNGQAMYDPTLTVRENMSIEEYRHGKSSSIHHFYEKLLKLKDYIHTETGKRLAEERHLFMEHFLKQFFKEWNGEFENFNSGRNQ